MAKPNSRATLISYCKRALGHPVIEINIDEDQVDDRIDEALQFYQEYHADAIERVYLKHKIVGSTLQLTAAVAGNFQVGEVITGSNSGATALVHKNSTGNKIIYTSLTHIDRLAFESNETITGSDSSTTATVQIITKGDIENKFIGITELVTNVVRVMPINDTNSSNNLFDAKYQMHLNDMYSLGYMGNLVDYEMKMQWLSLLDMIIDSDEKHISFDRHKNQLRIDMDWEQDVPIDNYLAIECYRVIDPATYTDVYNDYFLKRYATALIKYQWGANLIKFEGMVMPGGVSFNGRQIFDDAKEEITKLEEEARLNWEEPVDFYIG